MSTSLHPTTIPQLYSLSLHDALPICSVTMMLFLHLEVKPLMTLTTVLYLSCALISGHLAMMLMELTSKGRLSRSEERFSRNAETDLVCRLLREKKKRRSGRRAGNWWH